MKNARSVFTMVLLLVLVFCISGVLIAQESGDQKSEEGEVTYDAVPPQAEEKDVVISEDKGGKEVFKSLPLGDEGTETELEGPAEVTYDAVPPQAEEKDVIIGIDEGGEEKYTPEELNQDTQ